MEQPRIDVQPDDAVTRIGDETGAIVAVVVDNSRAIDSGQGFMVVTFVDLTYDRQIVNVDRL